MCIRDRTSTWYSSRRVAETYSAYKVLIEEGTDRILGAHILGGEAGEVINLFTLAIRSGMRATDLKHMLFAYPTSGSNTVSYTHLDVYKRQPTVLRSRLE